MSRVSKNALGQTTSFLRDGAYVTDPVIADNLATYTPGISERRGGTTRYSHSGLKNTGAQSTSSIAATRVYDAYGAVRSFTGSWAGPFGYAGDYGYQEDETGLRLLGHRYYDASTGRFLTRDPIKDGRNWYSYCDGDPINGVDPTGLEWHDPSHVNVDKGFKGKVWVVGEPGPGKPQTMVQVGSGQSSPEGMDVDYVIVQYENGTQRRYFLPGTNPPSLNHVESFYDVDAKGKVSIRKPVDVFLPHNVHGAGGFAPIPYPNPRGQIGHPVEFDPRERGRGRHYPPGLLGGGPTGNWNDDIERAKKRGHK